MLEVETKEVIWDKDIGEEGGSVDTWHKRTAKEYREWLSKQEELGREVYYLCSLDT